MSSTESLSVFVVATVAASVICWWCGLAKIALGYDGIEASRTEQAGVERFMSGAAAGHH
ncbi:hypothetical protein ACFRR7_26115 [Streptomyces sp. NPDC056909]|uniref:hypothetical protein n=1 Tax=Streptomyces sp. NPDC056909 TaxID=3345963 RepID=UPI00368B3C91